MAAIGWYGPLIDLSKAAFHIGDYVQLLVFVHKSRPIQKFKSSREGALLRTDIQVGDDTCSFFSVSLWQKQIGSMVFAGDVILLQNVKIVRFGEIIEARTVQFSSLLHLVHPYELLVSKGVDDLLADCRVGKTTKGKLKKVIEWVQRVGSTVDHVQLHTNHMKPLKNWKVHEEKKYVDCVSISEASCLTDSCNASFFAYVGEIFLPFSCGIDGESEKEWMFIRRRLSTMGDNKIAEDLICTGCKLCGSPMALEYGYGRFIFALLKNTIQLYCQESVNHLHIACLIYRPFLLYVWDQSDYIPLLVTNKAAELLFANITAEKVYLCYRAQKQGQNLDSKDDHEKDHCDPRASAHSTAAAGEVAGFRSLDADKSLEPIGIQPGVRKNPDFYRIWLILLKMLLQHGKNSSLKFDVRVNTSLDQDNGKFELVSVTMPCFGRSGPSG